MLKIIGIDLSGPSNWKDTVMTVFTASDEMLHLDEMIVGASDQMVMDKLMDLRQEERVTIGIDAPLSYQDGGGDRPQDKGLRWFMKEYGLNGSSVMPPTLTRMAYLTLRGIALTRRIQMEEELEHFTILEVHPGAAIGSRIPDVLHALMYKKDEESRVVVVKWMQALGLNGLPENLHAETHTVDACAAALAAWCYEERTSTWIWNDVSEAHPFVLCC
ncbi:DUF429 domain-containing protein [Mangrovibacillus cuniculi]|uniref:DUF429 domain-containing protein n=1 Tax=Mangrovibacillus cuniculi TaxID=2593652 RepID=A0A7S8CD85_9BACI|nr:DUF429 domain-containing protein [Mangrovibacillus cuniculi]QPC47866.1 DUF429 domain-containing protein [Mangrovibacillus cuniculi]